MRVNDISMPMTASFGVSTFRMGQDDTAQSLIERSDVALYRAKEAGRNLVRSERPPATEAPTQNSALASDVRALGTAGSSPASRK